MNTEYIVFDIETTGLSQKKNKIIEIGAVKVKDGEEIDRFSEFINPEEPIPYSIEQLTSITDEMVMHAPTVDVILPKFWNSVVMISLLHIMQHLIPDSSRKCQRSWNEIR